MDTDILVTGTLWHLLKLPSAIHFAASGLGFLTFHVGTCQCHHATFFAALRTVRLGPSRDSTPEAK